MKRSTLWLWGACAIAAIASYLVTTHAASSASAPINAPALSRWLELTAAQQAQIAADDPAYDTDIAVLQEKVAGARDGLATMLVERKATDEEILSQVDAVSAAENSLQRRITQHVLSMRQRLTPQQQANLLGLCAGAMRGQGGGRGMGMGRGFMGGRGDPSMEGRGRGYQGGRGVQ